MSRKPRPRKETEFYSGASSAYGTIKASSAYGTTNASSVAGYDTLPADQTELPTQKAESDHSEESDSARTALQSRTEYDEKDAGASRRAIATKGRKRELEGRKSEKKVSKKTSKTSPGNKPSKTSLVSKPSKTGLGSKASKTSLGGKGPRPKPKSPEPAPAEADLCAAPKPKRRGGKKILISNMKLYFWLVIDVLTVVFAILTLIHLLYANQLFIKEQFMVMELLDPKGDEPVCTFHESTEDQYPAWNSKSHIRCAGLTEKLAQIKDDGTRKGLSIKKTGTDGTNFVELFHELGACGPNRFQTLIIREKKKDKAKGRKSIKSFELGFDFVLSEQIDWNVGDGKHTTAIKICSGKDAEADVYVYTDKQRCDSDAVRIFGQASRIRHVIEELNMKGITKRKEETSKKPYGFECSCDIEI